MALPDRLRLSAPARLGLARESVLVSLFALLTTGMAGLALALQGAPQAETATAAAVVALAGLLGIGIDLRRRADVWSRFEVRLSADAIEAGPAGGLVRSIARSDARHVVRTVWPARGVVVVGPHGTPPVFVPEGLDAFSDVVTELGKWRPISASRVPEAVVRAWPVVIVGIAALEAVVLGARDPLLVATAAGLLALLGLWSLGNTLRSRRLSVRARALSLLLLVPIGFVIWRAVTALRG
jgi:hypothetical protein